MTSRVRLGDVAMFLTPTKGQRESIPAKSGDVVLMAASRDGDFATRTVQEGETLAGRHVIIIRVLPDSALSSRWLLLWTQTDEFAAMMKRHSRGATVRTVSVQDLAEFEMAVPGQAVQARASALLERLDSALEANREVVAALEVLRVTEQRRIYAEASAVD